MRKSQIFACIVAVVVIVLALGAWYVGAHPTLAAQFGFASHASSANGTASTTRRFNGSRDGFVMGSIEILSGNGFTVTLADGTTKNVTLTATTTIQNYANASSTPTTITADQLSVGESVFVMGESQPDGSVIAARVRTGAMPTFNGMRGPRPGQPAATATPR